MKYSHILNYSSLNVNDSYVDKMVKKYGTIQSALYNMTLEEAIKSGTCKTEEIPKED